jgi:uncharacterized protein (TIGR02145 family)
MCLIFEGNFQNLLSSTNLTIMRKTTLCLAAAALLGAGLQAQICDPSVAPTGLVSTYIPGSGALLEWDAVPGSVGVQLRVDLPAGSTINRRIVGPGLDQFAVPDAFLSPGTYTWRVQAACSTVPPYDVTPISASSSFSVGVACPSTVTDIDGNVYSTVQIGAQCWMQQNLKALSYRNGDGISTALSDSAWSSTTSGAYAVYDDSLYDVNVYGLLYNWFAVDDSRGLCPTGWRVPTDPEWRELRDFLGGASIAGGPMKTPGTIDSGGVWFSPNLGATNSSEFSAVPGGRRDSNGSYLLFGQIGSFWSSTQSTSTLAWYFSLNHSQISLDRFGNPKQVGRAVRCIKD